MKIFYGVQGTGNGHLSRARMMAKQFANYPDIEVQFLFTGRDPDKYFDMEVFGDYMTRTGLTFVTRKGQIQKIETLIKACKSRIFRDIKNLDLSSYDLVISDYEPITSWAAKRQGKKCIALGHQSAFNYDIPVEGDNIITRHIMKMFAPGDIGIGLHWWHFEQPILPPIIDNEALDQYYDYVYPRLNVVDLDGNIKLNYPDEKIVLSTSETGPQVVSVNRGYILVYLPFENRKTLEKVLSKFPGTKFICYGHSTEYETYHNLEFRPASYKGFQESLAYCDGVIANAGFELNSEALYLSKPILVKPVEGQMEQMTNAYTLDDILDFGYRTDRIEVDSIEWFLDLINMTTVIIRWPDTSKAIVEWIVDGANPDLIQQLSDDLWAEVDSRDNF